MTREKFTFPQDAAGTRGAVKATADGLNYYIPSVLHGADGKTPIGASNPLPVSILVMSNNAAFSGSSNMIKVYDRSMFSFGIKNKHTLPLTFTINGNAIEVDGGEGWNQNFDPFTEVSIVASGPFKAFALTYPNFAGIITPEPEIPDTEPPNAVTGLVASNLASTGLTLTWVASTSTDVIGYQVYRGATLLATITSVSYNVTGLTAETLYTFSVKAKDAAGNLSTSLSVNATTTATPVDTTPPNNVTGLSVINLSTTTLTLTWVASSSSDVAGYDVYNGSTLLGSVTNTSYNVTGLTASTGYTFTVKAKDAANNISSGTSVPATTTSIPVEDTTPPVVTASVAGGSYNSAQSVALTANEQADIYYTLDGSTPTQASAKYSIPLLIGATATLKFIGKDAAGNVSAVQTEIYTITITETGHVTDGLVQRWDVLTSQVSLSNSGSYATSGSNAEFSITATIKPKNYLNIFSQFNVGSTNSFRFYLQDNSALQVSFWGKNSGTPDFPSIKSTDNLTIADQYYHVSVVRTSTDVTLRVNNAVVATGPMTSSFVLEVSSEPIRVADVSCDVKNVSFYNKALSTAELTRNYNASL